MRGRPLTSALHQLTTEDLFLQKIFHTLFWKALPYVEPLLFLFFLYYALPIIAFAFISDGFDNDETKTSSFINACVFILFISISIIFYSSFRFFFTKNRDKVHELLFYWLSLPTVCSYIIDFVTSSSIYRLLISKSNSGCFFYMVFAITVFIQPYVMFRIFRLKEKIKKDVIFLYMIPVCILSCFILHFIFILLKDTFFR